jgi:hypothetical protein
MDSAHRIPVAGIQRAARRCTGHVLNFLWKAQCNSCMFQVPLLSVATELCQSSERWYQRPSCPFRQSREREEYAHRFHFAINQVETPLVAIWMDDRAESVWWIIFRLCWWFLTVSYQSSQSTNSPMWDFWFIQLRFYVERPHTIFFANRITAITLIHTRSHLPIHTICSFFDARLSQTDSMTSDSTRVCEHTRLWIRARSYSFPIQRY